MAKEEELKRVDLKVNVSCCDGCRRKVMKAMNLKGVLRTEIHPSLDRVTVVGNVDTKVLVKKLAKVGKIAEVVEAAVPEQQKKREGDVYFLESYVELLIEQNHIAMHFSRRNISEKFIRPQELVLLQSHPAKNLPHPSGRRTSPQTRMREDAIQS
ncbi:hypothetical protein TRIUR3_16128 [Triticum urartu]|uniref:HMA domain-containing protein n=1 Tax=Triticum urartu TaxID=4572 RepID=M7Z1E0_TRIUA|nr:hypothetical protein TRIUR3_16128 [Triticum urartu]